MDSYIFKLMCNIDEPLEMPLFVKTNDSLSEENQDEIIVYDDYQYWIEISNTEGSLNNIERVFLNDEDVECKISYIDDSTATIKFLNRRIFLECYGVAQISVLIDGNEYFTQPLSVYIKESNQNENILNMISYIYDNCENYLYEDHYKNQMKSDAASSRESSVQAKLKLAERILDTYQKVFPFFKNSPSSELINRDKVDSFSKLRDISPNTIRYIVAHVDELEAVHFNSGISFSGQYYQPRNTLVKSVHYSFDIEENRAVCGFLLTLRRNLNEMKKVIMSRLYYFSQHSRRGQYLDSKYYIYQKSRRVLEKYREDTEKIIDRVQRTYHNYKSVLKVNDKELSAVPRFTNIFKRVIPYRQVFEEIYKWFNSGGYDLSKEDMVLSFLSTSKIYEYFDLLKMIHGLCESGWICKSNKRFSYKEDYYYKNTRFCNTFFFEKNNTRIVLYFQPKIISGAESYNRNGVSLYRNTSFSLSGERRGYYYTPDYIIKITKLDGKSSYFIIDAKFSERNDIKKLQLTDLVFKYLVSISTLNKSDSLDGLYILCGKSANLSSYNLFDLSQAIGEYHKPAVKLYDINAIGTDSTKAMLSDIITFSM